MSVGKRAKRRDAQTAGVRDRILDAALAVLRETGLQRFTQVQVAEGAGVRQSHLTYYFPTREALLAAVMTHAVDSIVSQVQGAVGDAGRGATPAMFTRLAMAVANVGHMRMLVGLVIEADGDPALRALLGSGIQRLETMLAAALGGDDADERARMVLAATWGLGLYHFAARPARATDPTRSYLAWIARAAQAPNAGA